MLKKLILSAFLIAVLPFSINGFVTAQSSTDSAADSTTDGDVTTVDTDTGKNSPFDPQRLKQKRLEVKNQDLVEKCREEGSDSEECVRVTDFAFTTLLEKLIAMLDRLEVRLGVMVAEAVEREELTQEEGDALVAEYSTLIAEFKTELENATTTLDLRTAFAKFRAESRYRDVLRKMSAVRMSHSFRAIDNAIERLSNFAAKVEEQIAAAQGVGHDTVEVEGYVQSAKDKITQAEALAADRDKTDFATTKATFLEIKELLRGAHEDLKNAVKGLKELHREVPWRNI